MECLPVVGTRYWYEPKHLLVTFKGQRDLNFDFSHGKKGKEILTLRAIGLGLLSIPTEAQATPVKTNKDYVWYMSEAVQLILAEFLRLGNATVKELEALTQAHPATISRTMRLARRYGHTVVYSSDSDGGNRFYVDFQGHIPQDSGRGVNRVNDQDILNWITDNSGWWFDSQIAAGLGLDSNKHESVGAAVRQLLQQEKLNKRYLGKLRQVSSKGEERTA